MPNSRHFETEKIDPNAIPDMLGAPSKPPVHPVILEQPPRERHPHVPGIILCCETGECLPFSGPEVRCHIGNIAIDAEPRSFSPHREVLIHNAVSAAPLQHRQPTSREMLRDVFNRRGLPGRPPVALKPQHPSRIAEAHGLEQAWLSHKWAASEHRRQEKCPPIPKAPESTLRVVRYGLS